VTGVVLVLLLAGLTTVPACTNQTSGGPPRGKVIEVTGYSQLSLAQGPRGAVTVKVSGRQAAALRAALSTLSSTPPSVCSENISDFTISVRPYVGARPTYIATEENCPTPGVVIVTAKGAKTETLKEDCAVQNAVFNALPKGRATATWQDRAPCSSQ
jgi:hypothetical protein